MFDVLLSALAPILFHIPYSLLIQLLSEQRPEVTSVSLCIQLGFHEMEINLFGKSVSFLVRGNRVITCGTAVQQRVKQHSWILTITPFIHGTCSLIPFHQATEGQERSRYNRLSGCELTCQQRRLLIVAHARQWPNMAINGPGCQTQTITPLNMGKSGLCYNIKTSEIQFLLLIFLRKHCIFQSNHRILAGRWCFAHIVEYYGSRLRSHTSIAPIVFS